MKAITFSDEQLTYLRRVVMDSITDDANFLRRINRGQSPQMYKDNTAAVEIGSDIMAKLKGQAVADEPFTADFVARQNALGIIPVAPIQHSKDPADYVAECLDVLGITREQYDKAMAKRCVHGSLASQPCAECDNTKPVGATCTHGVLLSAHCSECVLELNTAPDEIILDRE